MVTTLMHGMVCVVAGMGSGREPWAGPGPVNHCHAQVGRA